MDKNCANELIGNKKNDKSSIQIDKTNLISRRNLMKRKELCENYFKTGCSNISSCYYMHGEFPCKFFYLGLNCPDGDLCKLKHGEPLNAEQEFLLLVHIQSATNVILKDFPTQISMKQAKNMIRKHNLELSKNKLDKMEEYSTKSLSLVKTHDKPIFEPFLNNSKKEIRNTEKKDGIDPVENSFVSIEKSIKLENSINTESLWASQERVDFEKNQEDSFNGTREKVSYENNFKAKYARIDVNNSIYNLKRNQQNEKIPNNIEQFNRLIQKNNNNNIFNELLGSKKNMIPIVDLSKCKINNPFSVHNSIYNNNSVDITSLDNKKTNEAFSDTKNCDVKFNLKSISCNSLRSVEQTPKFYNCIVRLKRLNIDIATEKIADSLELKFSTKKIKDCLSNVNSLYLESELNNDDRFLPAENIQQCNNTQKIEKICNNISLKEIEKNIDVSTQRESNIHERNTTINYKVEKSEQNTYLKFDSKDDNQVINTHKNNYPQEFENIWDNTLKENFEIKEENFTSLAVSPKKDQSQQIKNVQKCTTRENDAKIKSPLKIKIVRKPGLTNKSGSSSFLNENSEFEIVNENFNENIKEIEDHSLNESNTYDNSKNNLDIKRSNRYCRKGLKNNTSTITLSENTESQFRDISCQNIEFDNDLDKNLKIQNELNEKKTDEICVENLDNKKSKILLNDNQNSQELQLINTDFDLLLSCQNDSISNNSNKNLKTQKELNDKEADKISSKKLDDKNSKNPLHSNKKSQNRKTVNTDLDLLTTCQNIIKLENEIEDHSLNESNTCDNSKRNLDIKRSNRYCRKGLKNNTSTVTLSENTESQFRDISCQNIEFDNDPISNDLDKNLKIQNELNDKKTDEICLENLDNKKSKILLNDNQNSQELQLINTDFDLLSSCQNDSISNNSNKNLKTQKELNDKEADKISSKKLDDKNSKNPLRSNKKSQNRKIVNTDLDLLTTCQNIIKLENDSILNSSNLKSQKETNEICTKSLVNKKLTNSLNINQNSKNLKPDFDLQSNKNCKKITFEINQNHTNGLSATEIMCDNLDLFEIITNGFKHENSAKEIKYWESLTDETKQNYLEINFSDEQISEDAKLYRKIYSDPNKLKTSKHFSRKTKIDKELGITRRKFITNLNAIKFKKLAEVFKRTAKEKISLEPDKKKSFEKLCTNIKKIANEKERQVRAVKAMEFINIFNNNTNSKSTVVLKEEPKNKTKEIKRSHSHRHKRTSSRNPNTSTDKLKLRKSNEKDKRKDQSKRGKNASIQKYKEEQSPISENFLKSLYFEDNLMKKKLISEEHKFELNLKDQMSLEENLIADLAMNKGNEYENYSPSLITDIDQPIEGNNYDELDLLRIELAKNSENKSDQSHLIVPNQLGNAEDIHQIIALLSSESSTSKYEKTIKSNTLFSEIDDNAYNDSGINTGNSTSISENNFDKTLFESNLSNIFETELISKNFDQNKTKQSSRIKLDTEQISFKYLEDRGVKSSDNCKNSESEQNFVPKNSSQIQFKELNQNKEFEEIISEDLTEENLSQKNHSLAEQISNSIRNEILDTKAIDIVASSSGNLEPHQDLEEGEILDQSDDNSENFALEDNQQTNFDNYQYKELDDTDSFLDKYVEENLEQSVSNIIDKDIEKIKLSSNDLSLQSTFKQRMSYNSTIKEVNASNLLFTPKIRKYKLIEILLPEFETPISFDNLSQFEIQQQYDNPDPRIKKYLLEYNGNCNTVYNNQIISMAHLELQKLAMAQDPRCLGGDVGGNSRGTGPPVLYNNCTFNMSVTNSNVSDQKHQPSALQSGEISKYQIITYHLQNSSWYKYQSPNDQSAINQIVCDLRAELTKFRQKNDSNKKFNIYDYNLHTSLEDILLAIGVTIDLEGQLIEIPPTIMPKINLEPSVRSDSSPRGHQNYGHSSQNQFNQHERRKNSEFEKSDQSFYIPSEQNPTGQYQSRSNYNDRTQFGGKGTQNRFNDKGRRNWNSNQDSDKFERKGRNYDRKPNNYQYDKKSTENDEDKYSTPLQNLYEDESNTNRYNNSQRNFRGGNRNFQTRKFSNSNDYSNKVGPRTPPDDNPFAKKIRSTSPLPGPPNRRSKFNNEREDSWENTSTFNRGRGSDLQQSLKSVPDRATTPDWDDDEQAKPEKQESATMDWNNSSNSSKKNHQSPVKMVQRGSVSPDWDDEIDASAKSEKEKVPPTENPVESNHTSP